MSQNKHYELMVIFTPILSNDEFKAAAQSLTNFITTNNGSIVAEDFWGLKSLAYPIDKKTTGLYYILEYSTTDSINNKLEIQMNRNESIMRFMLTSLNKYAIAYNDRKRKGIKVEPKRKSTSTVNETTEA